jgi:protein-histidine pros-kinase
MSGWRRFDTLFLRLFLLMWVALVLSNFVAFSFVVSTEPEVMRRGPGNFERNFPAMPSLPPGSLFGDVSRPRPPRDAQMQRMPDMPDGPQPWHHWRRMSTGMLWLDYAIRAAMIAAFAAIGARWLAAPMKRLSEASTELAHALREERPVPRLDEDAGTGEVRQTARVFNDVARRLQAQFDLRGLHMAAVSHDLRTPLTRMRIRLENTTDPVAAQCVRDIQEMNQLIDDSLAVLREQREEAPASTVDVVSLVQAMADDLQMMGRKVSVADDVPEGRVLVRAHPAGLRRVLGNVIGNAVAHGASARISLRSDGQHCVIVVDDDGPGIPQGQLEAVMRPWKQLQRGGSSYGYGLGLAISQDLLARDGASMQLTNRPEGGLRVEITLRAA